MKNFLILLLINIFSINFSFCIKMREVELTDKQQEALKEYRKIMGED